MSAAPKTIIIGLDGGTFTVLKPFMDTGHMPRLKQIADSGIRGELETTVPPLTGPAWASFQTGLNPGRHGLYDFLVMDARTGRESPINHSLIKGRSFWEYASDAGSSCLIMNVPVTYPPTPIKGALITDFLTPSGKRDFMHPVELVEEIEKKFGPYPINMHMPAFSPNLSDANTEAFLDELNEVMAYKFDVAHYLYDKYGSDLLVLHVFETDRLQHELWHYFDKTHLQFTREKNEKFYGKIVRFYEHVDSQIARLIDHVGSDSNVIIVSDHGFGPSNWLVDINAVFLNAGLITIKKDLLPQLRYLLWKCGITFELAFHLFVKPALKYFWKFYKDTAYDEFLKFSTKNTVKVLLNEQDIDWQQTKAVGKYFNGAIFVNRKGVLPQGWLEDEAEIEAVRREIEKVLAGLCNPETGELVGGELIPGKQAFSGEFAYLCPDFTYLPNDNGYRAGTMMGFCSNKPVLRNFIQPGNHTRLGVLMASGPAFATGKKITGARFMDIGPTTLHIMGHKVPGGLDGRVLTELFTEGFALSRPVEYLETCETSRQDNTYSDDDQQNVVEKLKGLGYL